MRLGVLALDYDGTVASGDALDATVRQAIAFARATGVTVLLVTGRSLDELRRVAGDLHFVDGVVAENGAVVHFPDTGYISTLAPRVPVSLVEELRRRGVPFSQGECLVDASAADGSTVRVDSPTCHAMLQHLTRGQAVALPITEEAGGGVRYDLSESENVLAVPTARRVA